MARRAADLRQIMQASARGKTRSTNTGANPVVSVTKYPDNPHYRPGRAGRANVTGYFPQEVKKQLRFLAAEKDTTIQNLLAEALNDLFAKNGKPEIVPIESD